MHQSTNSERDFDILVSDEYLNRLDNKDNKGKENKKKFEAMYNRQKEYNQTIQGRKQERIKKSEEDIKAQTMQLVKNPQKFTKEKTLDFYNNQQKFIQEKKNN